MEEKQTPEEAHDEIPPLMELYNSETANTTTLSSYLLAAPDWIQHIENPILIETSPIGTMKTPPMSTYQHHIMDIICEEARRSYSVSWRGTVGSYVDNDFVDEEQPSLRPSIVSYTESPLPELDGVEELDDTESQSLIEFGPSTGRRSWSEILVTL